MQACSVQSIVFCRSGMLLGTELNYVGRQFAEGGL